MSEISVYDIVPTPKLADKLIGTSVGGVIEDVTYNFTLQELLQLFIPNLPANNLQGVLNYGNTATQNINLTGTITTTNLSVLATANILNSNLSGNTRVMAGLFDRTNASGTAGQFLRSTGTQVEWFTIPTVIPTLQQVLTSGNTADRDIILTANITAVTATAANVVSNTALSVNGVLRDGTAAAGGSNQILSSTGSGVRWVDLPVYNVISPLLYNTTTKTFSIQPANGSQNGYLSSADWINFDGKQDAIILTTTGTSGAATFVGNTLNIPVYTPDLSGYVPISRTLTINGTTYDLSANRSWTIDAGVAEVTATAPLSSSGGAYPDISISQSNSSTDGYLSSADWLDFNSKQDGLNGTGIVKSTAGTITYITDNSTNWNTAYNESIISAAVTGTSTKTLTLNQQDGGTVTANWTDNGLTSVGVSMPSAFTVTNSPLTSNGTIAITGAGTSLQYVDGTGALQTFPGLTGFVPYTGATTNVDLGTHNLTATSLIKLGGTSGQFLKADGSVDSSAYITLASLSAASPLSYDNSIGAFSISQAGASANGYLSSTDWNTFNNKQVAGNYITSLTGEATGTGPGATAVTLNNASVTGKVLTGVNITGGTVLATDTMLTAFGKLQNQINGLVGSTIYQGVWDASTNTPTLTSSVGTNGFYYIVNVAGSTNLNGITDWKIGDWAIFNGGVWQKVDNTESVTSVNGFTGAVSLTTDNIAQGTTNLYFANSLARTAVSLTTTGSSGVATYNNTTGVFNIPNYGSALSGYLPLTGGTLTGGLYINPANTAVVGLEVASDTIRLRSDSTQPFARQLTTTMGSGTLVKMQAAGFGGTYVTDLGFYTSSSSAINTTPNLYLTGGNNRVGINTDVPAHTLDVVGTAGVSGVLTLGSTISNGTFTYTLPGATGTLALVGGAGVGTVTSVAALTLGTTGTDLSSTVANGTTTPVITLNVPTASATNRGALSSADWTTFNSKQATITLTTTSSSGASTFISNTLNVPNYTLEGLGGQPSATNLTSLSGLTFASTSFVKMTAAGTFALDTNTYALSSALANYLPLAGGTMTGQIVLKEGTTSTDYSKGLRFPNDPYGGSGDTSGLRLYANTAVGFEAQILELYVTNDGATVSQDKINFAAPTNDFVTINGNKIWNEGNLPSPQSAITLTTTGTSGAATLVGATLNIPQYQSVLTNPITGSLTTNFIPKATGATTIGNSIISEVSSRISITSATAYGWIYSNDTNHSIILRADRDGTVLNYTNYYQYGGTLAEGLGHKFWTGGDIGVQSLRLQIADNGVYVANRLGVGTTTPGGLLDISGGQYNTGLIVRSASTNGTGVAILNSDTGGHNWYLISTASSNGGGAGNLGFYSDTNGNYLMYIKGSNGNVQIGSTTDAGYKLDVNGTGRFSGSANTMLTLDSTNSGGYTATQINASGVFKALIGFGTYLTTDGGVAIRTATSTPFTIAIGSAVPNFTIASTGAATFSSSVTATSLGVNVSSIYGKFEIAGAANTYATAPAITFTDTAGTGDSNRWIIGNIATDYGSFNIASAPTPSSTTWTPRITITKTGSVGIGTTSPNDKFVVDGGNNIWSGVFRGTTTASQSFGVQIFGGTNANDTAFRILNGATTSTYMLVRGDGNVGIGTASPSAKLDVQGGYSLLNGLRISGSDTSNTIYAGSSNMAITSEPGYNISIGRVSDTSRSLNVNTSSGATSISTTTNYSRLHVHGGALSPSSETTYGVWVSEATTVEKGLILGYDNAGNVGIINAVHRGQSWRSIAIGTNSGSNVLIGTTVDNGAKLQVAGVLSMGTTGTNYIRMGVFPNSITNTGEAWIGRAADRNAGTMTVQLGGNSASSRSFEVVDFAWSVVLFSVGSNGNVLSSGSMTATSFFESSDATIKTLITDNYQAKGIESVVAKLYTKNGKEELGYYAQDVQGILPSAVSKGEDGLLSLSYREVLVAKVQFLEQRVKELEAKLN